METTESIMTVHSRDVSPGEIHEVRVALTELVEHGEVAEDSALVAALYFILDTLNDGVDMVLITEPAFEDYTLA